MTLRRETTFKFHAVSSKMLHGLLIFGYQTTLPQLKSPFLLELTAPEVKFLSPRKTMVREASARNFNETNFVPR